MQIKKYSPTSHKVKAVIYGASGSGKTTFAGNAKKAIFASAEGGLLSIADKNVDYVEIKSLQDLIEMRNYLSTQKHDFETVIIDSITEINDIIKLEIEKKTGKAMQLQDWGTLQKRIVEVLRSFRDLDMNVLFIAQEKEASKDENGVSAKLVPNLNGDMADRIAYFMDIVGYIYITKTGEHKVITSANPRLLTKDRTNLIGNDEQPNFQSWIDKVRNMKTVENQEITTDITDVKKEQADSVVKSKNSKAVKDVMLARLVTFVTAEEIEQTIEKIKTSVKLTEDDRKELLVEFDSKLAGVKQKLEDKSEEKPEDIQL